MTKTVKGRVQAISPKPQQDYMGVKAKINGNEEWFNGSDEDVPSMSKGDLIKIQHDDGWINEIDIIEEDSEGGQNTADSDAGMGRGTSNSGKSSSTPNPKRANIQATAATKKAADIVQEQADFDSNGEYIEQVSEVANGLNNVMNNLYEANME